MTPSEMAALHRRCFDVAPRAWSAEEFTEYAARPDIYIAMDAHGFAVVRFAGGESELLTVAVAPDQRRKGIAERLLRDAMKFAHSKNASEMFLEVADQNASAVALYQKLGFAQVGLRKDYYTKPRGTKMSALVMRCAI